DRGTTGTPETGKTGYWPHRASVARSGGRRPPRVQDRQAVGTACSSRAPAARAGAGPATRPTQPPLAVPARGPWAARPQPAARAAAPARATARSRPRAEAGNQRYRGPSGEPAVLLPVAGPRPRRPRRTRPLPRPERLISRLHVQ